MLSNYIGSSLSLGMSPSAVVPRLSDGLQAGDVLDSIYPPCDYIPYSADPLDEDREGDRCSINAFSSLSLCLMQTHAELCNLTCVSFDLATNLSVPFVSVKLASVYCFSDSLMRAHPNWLEGTGHWLLSITVVVPPIYTCLQLPRNLVCCTLTFLDSPFLVQYIEHRSRPTITFRPIHIKGHETVCRASLSLSHTGLRSCRVKTIRGVTFTLM